MEALRALADEKNIRDVRKLYQFARGRGEEVTMTQAAEALRTSTQRELLAPPAKALGHFAATRPGDQIQADLIDWGALNKKAKKGGGQIRNRFHAQKWRKPHNRQGGHTR